MTSQELPKTHRALVLSKIGTNPTVETIPVPQAIPGSIVVRVSFTSVLPYAREVYVDDTRGYTLPTPLVIGSGAVGRIAATGPDSVSLKPGQLVLVDTYIRGRDDPTISAISGLTDGYTPESKKLIKEAWKDSTYAEYARVPLENCYALDENRLLGEVKNGGLGYRVEDLMYIAKMLVPFGGLRDIDLKPGETIIVAPATGSFGGTAVEVAIALGARVIAAGRNVDSLKKLASINERVKTVQLTGDVETDTKTLQKFGPIDAFQEWAPPAAGGKATHIKSCMQALGVGGRVSLMGGTQEDIAINYSLLLHRNLTMKGNFMYKREDALALIKMVEAGVIKLGEATGYLKIMGTFPLEDWSQAFDNSAKYPGWGTSTHIAP